jgi:DNA-binding beta-propeller fold protein YncE
VALDDKGNIYVSDSYLGVIQVFSNDTRLRYVLSDNEKPYTFTSPTGITIDKKNRLYVCEMLKNKVSVFQLEQ